MKKIMFITQTQFGYHSSTYYMCKYLNINSNVCCLCWDYGKQKINQKGIEVKYISREGNIVIRNIRFLLIVLSKIKHTNFHVYFIKYFSN